MFKIIVVIDNTLYEIWDFIRPCATQTRTTFALDTVFYDSRKLYESYPLKQAGKILEEVLNVEILAINTFNGLITVSNVRETL